MHVRYRSHAAVAAAYFLVAITTLFLAIIQHYLHEFFNKYGEVGFHIFLAFWFQHWLPRVCNVAYFMVVAVIVAAMTVELGTVVMKYGGPIIAWAILLHIIVNAFIFHFPKRRRAWIVSWFRMPPRSAAMN